MPRETPIITQQPETQNPITEQPTEDDDELPLPPQVIRRIDRNTPSHLPTQQIVTDSLPQTEQDSEMLIENVLKEASNEQNMENIETKEENLENPENPQNPEATEPDQELLDYDPEEPDNVDNVDIQAQLTEETEEENENDNDNNNNHEHEN